MFSRIFWSRRASDKIGHDNAFLSRILDGYVLLVRWAVEGESLGPFRVRLRETDVFLLPFTVVNFP